MSGVSYYCMPTKMQHDLPQRVKVPYVAEKIATREADELVRFKVSCPKSKLIVIGLSQGEDGFLIPDDHTLVTISPLHYLNPFRKRIRESAFDSFIEAHSELGLRCVTFYEVVGKTEMDCESSEDIERTILKTKQNVTRKLH